MGEDLYRQYASGMGVGKGVDLGPAASRGVGLGNIGRCLFVFMLRQLCCALVIMKDDRSDAVSETSLATIVSMRIVV